MNAAGSTSSSTDAVFQLPTPPSRPFSIAELHADIVRERQAAYSHLSSLNAEEDHTEASAEQRAQVHERISLHKTRAAAAKLYEDGELARRLRCRWDSWSRTAEEKDLHNKKVERQRKKRKLSPAGAAAGGPDGQTADDGSISTSRRVCLVEDNQNERAFDTLLPVAFRFDAYSEHEDQPLTLAQTYAHRVELSEQNLLRKPIPAQELDIGGLGSRVKAAIQGGSAQREQDPCLIFTIDVYSRPVLVKTRRSRKEGRNGTAGTDQEEPAPRTSPAGSEPPHLQPDRDLFDEAIVEEGDYEDNAALSPSPEHSPKPLPDLDGAPVLTQTLEISSTSSLRLFRETIMCRWDDVPREDSVYGLDLPEYTENKVEDEPILVIEDTAYCSDLNSASFMEMFEYQEASAEEFPYRLDKLRSTEEITFNEIPALRAGKPYLLWHHGSCQHMLIIRSARAPLESEATSLSNGPLITFLSMNAVNRPGITSQRLAGYSSYHGGRCGVCEIRYPRYLFHGGERARLKGNADGLQGLPENLSLCEACLDVAVGRQEPTGKSDGVSVQHLQSDPLPSGGSEWTIIPLLDD